MCEQFPRGRTRPVMNYMLALATKPDLDQLPSA